MSNRKKDGDFNLDEELRNNIIASEDGQILSDDHEDIIEPDGNLEVDPLLVQKKANQKKYGIHPSLKCRDELVDIYEKAKKKSEVKEKEKVGVNLRPE